MGTRHPQRPTARRTRHKYRTLRSHSSVVRKRWEEIRSAIEEVQLPVTFYEGEGSQAAGLNEDLDEAATKAFKCVHDWVDRVDSGDLKVRTIAAEDVDAILSVLNYTVTPEEPGDSIGCVEDFAERVLGALRVLTNPHKVM